MLCWVSVGFWQYITHTHFFQQSLDVKIGLSVVILTWECMHIYAIQPLKYKKLDNLLNIGPLISKCSGRSRILFSHAKQNSFRVENILQAEEKGISHFFFVNKVCLILYEGSLEAKFSFGHFWFLDQIPKPHRKYRKWHFLKKKKSVLEKDLSKIEWFNVPFKV